MNLANWLSPHMCHWNRARNQAQAHSDGGENSAKDTKIQLNNYRIPTLPPPKFGVNFPPRSKCRTFFARGRWMGRTALSSVCTLLSSLMEVVYKNGDMPWKTHSNSWQNLFTAPMKWRSRYWNVIRYNMYIYLHIYIYTDIHMSVCLKKGNKYPQKKKKTKTPGP